MNSLEISTNCTTRFLLPIVFPNTTYDELIANGFIKAYIGMLDDENYDDSLLLLFNKDASDDVLGELFENMDVEVLDDEFDEDLQLVVINNWKDYVEDDDEYPTFLSGEWSKLSYTNKTHILSFWGEDEVSMLNMILNKDPKFTTIAEDYISTLFVGVQTDTMDEQEYWPRPDVIEDELYFAGDQ